MELQFCSDEDSAISQGHEPQKVYPTLPYWQSVKNIRIGHKFSQILTNDPQILTVNPYATSIYGCIRKKEWRLTPPGWLVETSLMITQ
jgi:hypothetical protein